jgi:hypothetical protein
VRQWWLPHWLPYVVICQLSPGTLIWTQFKWAFFVLDHLPQVVSKDETIFVWPQYHRRRTEYPYDSNDESLMGLFYGMKNTYVVDCQQNTLFQIPEKEELMKKIQTDVRALYNAAKSYQSCRMCWNTGYGVRKFRRNSFPSLVGGSSINGFDIILSQMLSCQ